MFLLSPACIHACSFSLLPAYMQSLISRPGLSPHHQHCPHQWQSTRVNYSHKRSDVYRGNSTHTTIPGHSTVWLGPVMWRQPSLLRSSDSGTRRGLVWSSSGTLIHTQLYTLSLSYEHSLPVVSFVLFSMLCKYAIQIANKTQMYSPWLIIQRVHCNMHAYMHVHACTHACMYACMHVRLHIIENVYSVYLIFWTCNNE